MSEIEYYPSPTNHGAMARFFDDKKLNPLKTELEKKPVFDDVVKVEVRTTGSRDIFIGPANTKWIEEFPQAWAAYQGQAVPVSGRQLSEIPNLGRMEAAYYQTRGIRTAEQLAEITDGNISSFGHGAYLHREAARKLTGWQEDKVKEFQAKEQTDMKDQIAKMAALIDDLKAEKEARELQELQQAKAPEPVALPEEDLDPAIKEEPIKKRTRRKAA